MDPEERKLLDEAIELSRENNKILKSMRRNARIGSFFRLIYWGFIIIAAVSSYYVLQPYIKATTDAYTSLQANLNTVKNISNKLPELPSWLGGKTSTTTNN